jgi:TolB-like protein/cytochrome c-type biogenesis protein CcmH/NrfG
VNAEGRFRPLVAELRRRRVFRALIAYGIVGFAVLQIIEPVMHGLHWPDAVLSYIVVALAAGFPVVLMLAWIFDVNEGRIERTAGKPLRTGMALALAGVGLLVAAPGAVYYLVVRRATPAQTPQGPSVAVLPLVNLSSDKEQEYFSDGLSEELLNLLAKVPGLHVAARTSTFAFKGKNEDVATIAEKLHVATVLEGSVRKSGDQIRITTQLVNAADGYHLWSETYDRTLTDVFAVQDDIARSVVDALKLKLLEPPTSMDRRTASTEAYNEYLLGQQFFRRNNVEGFRRAMQAYEKAVALDPGYAPAWAALALATFWVADSADSLTAVTTGQERAVAAADKAIALGRNLPDGYLARGFVRVPIQWDFDGARADLQRALSLKPEDPDVLSTYAQVVLRPLGRFPEAITALRKALELDPLNARVWSVLGSTLGGAGDFGAAREALNRSLEISPDQSFTSFHLGTTFLLEGEPAAAMAIYPRSSNEIFRFAGIALAEHSLGHPRESQRALDEMISRFAHAGAYQIAEVYAWRGEKDRALEWLERARVQRDGGFVNVKIDPLLRNLHGDARYTALLGRMHMPLD